jgi:hypothetical protein
VERWCGCSVAGRDMHEKRNLGEAGTHASCMMILFYLCSISLSDAEIAHGSLEPIMLGSWAEFLAAVVKYGDFAEPVQRFSRFSWWDYILDVMLMLPCVWSFHWLLTIFAVT